MSERSDTAALLARLSVDMAVATDGEDVQAVVERAVQMVPHAEHGSLTLRRAGGSLETVASTSQVAVRADQLQYELGQGPCVDAALRDEVNLVSDTRSSTRWPDWATKVTELGLNAVLSIRIGPPDANAGALNLYAGRSHAFVADDTDIAVSYAAFAGAALHANLQLQGLKVAMHSRHTIGVAQGILMNQYDLTPEQAFAVLSRYSSTTNTKLRDLAGYVATHRRLPRDTSDPATSDDEGLPA